MRQLLATAVFFVAASSLGWAQIDGDIPVTVTADCFSVCVADQNLRGVQGTITVKDLSANQAATLDATVSLLCNGQPVASVNPLTLTPITVGPLGTATFSYSLAFLPLTSCAYSVQAVGTNSLILNRTTTITQAFNEFACAAQSCRTVGCTLTQGFWKNHPDDWPVSTLTLGTVSYTEAQLLQILNQPVKGNGLVSLAHQLIAAKLNLANGASGGGISAVIAAADALIGGLIVPPIGSGVLSTTATGTLVTALDSFNNGLFTGAAGACAE
jgi:hypothetical protein